jgi:hypothetical protein
MSRYRARHAVREPITLALRGGVVTLPGAHGLQPTETRERWESYPVGVVSGGGSSATLTNAVVTYAYDVTQVWPTPDRAGQPPTRTKPGRYP